MSRWQDFWWHWKDFPRLTTKTFKRIRSLFLMPSIQFRHRSKLQRASLQPWRSIAVFWPWASNLMLDRSTRKKCARHWQWMSLRQTLLIILWEKEYVMTSSGMLFPIDFWSDPIPRNPSYIWPRSCASRIAQVSVKWIDTRGLQRSQWKFRGWHSRCVRLWGERWAAWIDWWNEPKDDRKAGHCSTQYSWWAIIQQELTT